MEALKQFDCQTCGQMSDIVAGDKLPTCTYCGAKMIQVMTTSAPYHNRYSLMHPRKHRGMKSIRPKVSWSEKQRIKRQRSLRRTYRKQLKETANGK